MGLASKMAASGGASMMGAPPGGYGGAPSYGAQQQQQQKPSGYPGQGSYQPYPGGPTQQSYQAQQQRPSYAPPGPQAYPPGQPQTGYAPNQQQPQYPGQPSYQQPPPSQASQQPPYQQQPYQQPPQNSYNQQSSSPYPSQAGFQQQQPPGQPYGYGQQQQQQQQQQQPPPQNYGAPPGGQQNYGAPPGGQQNYSAPPGGQQNYGAPMGGQDAGAYQRMLEEAVAQKGLQRFFPPGSPAMQRVAQEAAQKIPQLCQQWKLPMEVGRDLARLGLYDIVLFVDDSGSMAFEEHGERIQDLKVVLQRVAYASTLFDPDGISIRFMNTNIPEGSGDNIRDERQINQIVDSVKFSGLTPMGRELKRKVIDGIVLRDARQGQLKKPVLVIAITDGQPAGDDSPDATQRTIQYATQEMARAVPGSHGAIAFQFAQVGNDTKAREFLGRLDTDPTIGQYVDVTSNYEQEQEEMMRQQPPVDLTPDLWCVKLLLGSIDPSYDSKDEVRSYRPGGGQAAPQGNYGGGAPGSYGQPPQQPYGGQQQQYNQQPSQYGGQQQQYGQQPPQGQSGYGQNPQYGAPQGQGGYNQQQRPPQQGYGQQQPPPGQYGAPAPPRY